MKDFRCKILSYLLSLNVKDPVELPVGKWRAEGVPASSEKDLYGIVAFVVR